MKMKQYCILVLIFLMHPDEACCQTNAVVQFLDETKYWMPELDKIPNVSTLFENDLRADIEAFKLTKRKYEPLVKKWAAIYLKKTKDYKPRTLYVGPITPKISTIRMYDYEGNAFWDVGNIKSIEDPYTVSPVLVTKVYTFDFLLAGVCDANAKATQELLIRWQVANCVIDGLRVNVSAEDIAQAKFSPDSDQK